ncbi:hypothetical protein LCGC14_3166730, partial [marine sediment metagenome]
MVRRYEGGPLWGILKGLALLCDAMVLLLSCGFLTTDWAIT